MRVAARGLVGFGFAFVIGSTACGSTSASGGDGGEGGPPGKDATAPDNSSGSDVTFDSPPDTSSSGDAADASDASDASEASETGDASPPEAGDVPAVDAADSGDSTLPVDASDALIDAPYDAIPTPPPPPADATTTATTPMNFAIRKLYLGDHDFSGKSDPNAWESFGYNIDGKITTAASKNVCTLHAGGGSLGTSVQVDGYAGIDNSFGYSIFNNIILTIDAAASTTIDNAIATGSFTEMIDVTGLTGSATQTATGLTAQAFGGGPFGGIPTFTTADDWPVLPGNLVSTTPPFVSTQQFPDAYVVSGLWVSGPPGDITLPLQLSGSPLTLTVHEAVVTFQHSSATHAATGILSGVLDTKEFVDAIRTLAAHIGGVSFCSGGAIAGILAQIEDAQDILADGTNVKGKSCDAISIGIGFTADEIAQPTTLSTVDAGPSPCGDASFDAGLGDGGAPDAAPADAGPGGG